MRAQSLFPLDKFFEAATFNLVSRVMGFIVRSVTIFLAFITLLLVTYLGLMITAIWLLTPVLTIPLYLYTTRQSPLIRLQKTAQTLREVYNPLLKTPELAFFARRLNLNRNELEQLGQTAADAAIPDNFWEVQTLSDVFVALAKVWQPLKVFLHVRNIEAADVEAVGDWFEAWKGRLDLARRFWDRDALLRLPGIGAGWAYGYTVNLERFAHPLSIMDNPLGALVGREKEILALEEILSKSTRSSVIVAGEAGVGKLPIIETLATRIVEGEVYPALRHKRVLFLSLPTLVKESTNPTKIKGDVLAILKEAREAGNIILFIADIDRFICAREHEVILADVFAEILTRGGLQIIGTTTLEHYHDCIVTNPALNPLFEVVEVEEPDRASITTTLEAMSSYFESKHKVIITYQAIKEIIDTTSHLFPDTPYPQKAIDVLDKTVTHVANVLKRQVVGSIDVDEVVTTLSNIPLGVIKESEQTKLLQLEELIHQRIVDQEEAVKTISNAMRRGRLELKDRARPIGSFLFLGPTGVGKTETAKALASIYFGDSNRLVRFDMNQYQTEESIALLIGSRQGNAGLLSSAIRDQPYAVLLLDEFEKASTKIHNLFLTIFDEGYFTDTRGKKILCDHLIIIATSNAGAEFIREKGGQVTNQEIVNHVLEKAIFTPELINRFDSVVVYQPLTPKHLWQIARRELSLLNSRLKEKYDITLDITDELVLQLVTEGYNPEFGARPMRRVIQEKVESVVAEKLLKREVKRGEMLTMNIL